MGISLFSIIWMTFGRTAESWSQNHRGEYDWLLYPTLFGISLVYFVRSFMHQKKDEKMFRIIWIVRHRHWNRVIGIFFGIVFVFGVNAPFEWVRDLHLYTTACAILSANIGMVWYGYKRNMGLNGAIFGAAVGISLFVFSYLLPFTTIAEGEMFVSVPLMIHLFATTKIK